MDVRVSSLMSSCTSINDLSKEFIWRQKAEYISHLFSCQWICLPSHDYKSDLAFVWSTGKCHSSHIGGNGGGECNISNSSRYRGGVIRDTCVPSLSYSSLLYPGWRSHCARKKRKAFEHPILNTNKQATDENTQKTTGTITRTAIKKI